MHDLLLADDTTDFSHDFEQWIQDIYGGKPSIINRDILNQTAQILTKGILQGFTKSEYTEADLLTIKNLLHNTWEFAGFKTATQGIELNKLLVDNKGQIRSFNSFKLEAEKVGTIFNKTWLQTEYQHAIAASQSASKWVDIEKNCKVFPLLQYDTAGDDRVRPEHAAMDGITKPVNDSFWNSFYPPNGWNCRCTVRQLADGTVTDNKKINYPDETAVPPKFRYNVGKTGKAFPKDIPFIKNIPTSLGTVIINEVKQVEDIHKIIYDNYIELGYEALEKYNNGAYIVAHLEHGKQEPHEEIFFKNQFNYGKRVVLLENLRKKGVRYSDSLINETKYELKSYLNTQNYDNMIAKDFKTKSGQSSNLILHFTQDNFELENIFRRIKGSTKANKTITSISIAFKNSDIITYDREVILSNKFTHETTTNKAKKLLNIIK